MLSAVSYASSRHSLQMLPSFVVTTTTIARLQASHTSRFEAERCTLSCSANHMRSVSGNSTWPFQSSENRIRRTFDEVGLVIEQLVSP